ncbi:MAG: O-antigen ligase family protein, partial [Candidatus Omnitrophica bacterium]|nr:O-antigen ligase family protein [Candidatus Omnitrophota bacterium]
MSVISKKHSRYLALFFLIVIILFLCPAIRDRVFYTFHIGGDSKRFEKWLIAGKMIAAHPFLGTGVGTFMANFSKYLPKEAPAYAHNCYLQIWAETGIFSLLSFIAFTASLLYLGVRKFIVSADFLLLGLLGGTAGFLAHSFFDTNLYSLRLAVLFWAWLGLIAARINAFNGVELRAERAKSNDFNKRLQLIYSSVSYGAVQRLRCFAPLMVAYQVILRLPTLCFHWIKYIEEGAEKNKIDFLNKIINKIKYLNMRICYVEQKIWNRLTHWRLTQRLNAHNNYDVWLKNNDIAES